MSRLNRLKKRVAQLEPQRDRILILIGEYEVQRDLSSDPKVRAHATLEIDQLNDSLKRIDAELDSLETELEQQPSPLRALRHQTQSHYDVALSFAGPDRNVAREVAEGVMFHGWSVFFDENYRAALWGKSLYQELGEIYRDRCDYAVVFVSKDYVESSYTRRELAAAQDRALHESREFVLVVRLDDTEYPGQLKGDSFVDLRTSSIPDLIDLLDAKLRAL